MGSTSWDSNESFQNVREKLWAHSRLVTVGSSNFWDSYRPLLRVRRVVPGLVLGKSTAGSGTQLRMAWLWGVEAEGGRVQVTAWERGVWLGQAQGRHTGYRQGRSRILTARTLQDGDHRRIIRRQRSRTRGMRKPFEKLTEERGDPVLGVISPAARLPKGPPAHITR